MKLNTVIQHSRHHGMGPIAKWLLVMVIFIIVWGSPTIGEDIGSWNVDESAIVMNTILSFGTGVKDIFFKKARSNIGEQDNSLRITKVAFKTFGQTSSHFRSNNIGSFGPAGSDTDLDPVAGKPLVYPNPFRLEEGAELGYRLNKDMDIDLHIYDMTANLILKRSISAGSEGAHSSYNIQKIDFESFNRFALSTGVYFVLLVHDGNVLSKGKFAVIP